MLTIGKNSLITYEGCNFFRQRIILACLSGKPVKIEKIREKNDEPGIKDFEISFIRLIDRLSNGSKIIVNESGTEVKFHPGILIGGKIDHTCSSSRSIGYFLEPLIIIAPFCKNSLNVTFKGVTNNEIDPSIDIIRYSLIPILKKVLVTDEGLSLKIERRGLPPGGGGIVVFTCPVRRSLKAFQWEKMGKVKKIRGVVYTSRVAPIIGNRVMESAKEVLKNYLSDIYFTCDNAKGSSPGYGICLVAETNKECYFVAESLKCKENESQELDVPEDMGKKGAYNLLEEIYNAGCVDSLAQPLILSFMVLAPKDVSKVVLGPLTPYTMNFMKHLKDFFGVSFKMDSYRENADEDEELQLGAQKLLLTCVGVGYTNFGKAQI